MAQDQNIEIKLKEDFHKAEIDLDEYWKQRSRVQWTLHGDRNTKFFHSVATARHRTNLITQIMAEDGSTVTEDKEIRRVFIRYFKEIYCPSQAENSQQAVDFFDQFSDNQVIKIPTEAHQFLQRPPTVEEVKETLFQMGPDKAAGPDGITARFLQRNWTTFAHELTMTVRDAFLSGIPPQQWLQSRMVLIPKNAEPRVPKEYRPITIGNLTYRLLMKLVTNRLQPHIAKLISNNQTAFIKNRHIADNRILV